MKVSIKANPRRACVNKASSKSGENDRALMKDPKIAPTPIAHPPNGVTANPIARHLTALTKTIGAAPYGTKFNIATARKARAMKELPPRVKAGEA